MILTENSPRRIELLAPAKDAEIAIAAIDHGADAIYIGADKFGARTAAGNSVEDISRVVEYAHQFNARVYVTLNTIIKEDEIGEVEELIAKLYEIKVDALIIQDLGILRMNIPPISLHASTQCDIREVEKAQFLQSLGFSQLVLARELTLNEIKEIHNNVSIPLEAFVHGSLCVSYSGRCGVSQVLKGRSANRGECAQICRLPFDLIDGRGVKIETNKHLLSLKDLNQSDKILDLLEAGVSSFKIEGRLKDESYVKNVVAYYRQKIDNIILENPDKYQRASDGVVDIDFVPQLNKSFNRSFTNYFVGQADNINKQQFASFDTPKSLGEYIGKVKLTRGSRLGINTNEVLNNGDGISFFNRAGEYEGFRVNRVEGTHINTLTAVDITVGTRLYRTFNKQFNDILSGKSASRYISIDISLEQNNDKLYVVVSDALGNKISQLIDTPISPANKSQEESQQRVLAKVGNARYRVSKITTLNKLFIPSSILTEARRAAIEKISQFQLDNYVVEKRMSEDKDATYPYTSLTYTDNVSNSLARKVYNEHGVRDENIIPSLEVTNTADLKGDEVLMNTRYCIRRELGCCKKESNAGNITEPLTLKSGAVELSIEFDCAKCEMKLRRI